MQATFQLLRKPAVLKSISISSATMWRAIAAGLFPKPVRVGARGVAWVESEIDDWLEGRKAERIPILDTAELASSGGAQCDPPRAITRRNVRT